MKTIKADSAHKKIAQDQLTFADVRQAARAGLKAFDKFVLTGKLPIIHNRGLLPITAVQSTLQAGE
ncbi:hypothetical protein [Pseudomonas sp. SMN5]|uniref:hypothetical protein n=1 Tax=Pseudomonas sp. SMN5 TaxID=3390198 RepID=UPI003F83766C